LDFDGSTDYLSGAALSSFVSNSAGYIIASVLPDAITLNNAASYNNHGVFGAGPYAGVYLKDAATPKRAIAQNFDNFGGDGHDEAIASLTVTVGAPAVLEWRHEGGILYMRVNGASEASISSGPTDVMTSAFTLGVGYLSGGFYNGKVFEVASFSTVPDLATRDALVADFMNHVGLIGALDKTPCSGAWSASRDLLTSFLGASRYTDAGGGAISTFIDQSGNGRNLTDGGTSGRRPALTTAGPYLRTCLDFDGSTDYLSGAALSSFISNSTGYFVISFMADSITLNDAASYANHGVLGSEAFMGLYLKNAGTPKTAIAQNFDNVAGDGHTQASAASTVNTAVPCVLEWRHEGGNLYVRVNGANEASVTSGNTNDMTKALTIGIGYLSGGMLDGKIFEAAAFSTIPSSAKRDAIVANFMAHVGAS
jgi:hypothetical protein